MNFRPSVRSVIAIVLLVLLVVLLFWPSVVGLSAFGVKEMKSVSGIRSSATESIGDAFKYAKNYGFSSTLLGIAGILVNVCFFGMFAAVAAAIVLILLDKPNPAALVAMILAIVAVAASVVYAIASIEMFKHSGKIAGFIPGVAMFLLPICGVGAFVLTRD
ncbi:MAG: hypothetical protein IJJ86_05020 [Clostridia bacterium]|nr:hypothetical protein [Clostridia bacterium]